MCISLAYGQLLDYGKLLQKARENKDWEVPGFSLIGDETNLQAVMPVNLALMWISSQ